MDKFLENRIDEISKKYCIDYPHIESVTTLHKVSAIEQSLEGLERAVVDLHSVIKIMRKEFNITDEQYKSLVEKYLK